MSDYDKMSDCNSDYGYKKQKEKKHKLSESENVSVIIELDKPLNSTVQRGSMKIRKLASSEKESSRKTKVTDYEIESATVKKSDVESNKFHKKRKHKVYNNGNVSDGGILEINIQDIKNNTGLEIPKDLNLPKKKQRHSLSGEMGNVYRIKDYSKAENSGILDELYRRKRQREQTEFDVSDCLSADFNDVGLSQNNLNSEIFKDSSKQKRKIVKLATGEKLQEIANVESNHISCHAIYHEGVEEGVVENIKGQNISKLIKKNKHSKTEAENNQKKKHTNDPNEFDHKIVEPAVTAKLDKYINSNKFHGTKRKHKVTEDENVPECRIAESWNDISIKFSKGLKRQKKKKVQCKLLGETENVFNHQILAIDESGKNKTPDVLEIHKREDKHIQNEVDKISDCEIAKSNTSEINQNGSSSENVDIFHKKKKKKNRHKLLDEMENTSNCDTSCSNLIEVDQNNLSTQNVNIFPQKKKKKHKHKLLDEMGDISDFKTGDSNGNEVSWIDLNSEDDIHEKKKKKHKHKLIQEIKNKTDSEIGDLDLIEINGNDLNYENVNRFHEKKKKKHKHKLLDETENISDCKIKDSNPNEKKNNNLNKFNKKKQKHKLFSEIKNACNNTQEINIDEGDFDTLHVQKGNNSKSSDLDNISYKKTINSNAIEINHNELNIETFNPLHKIKIKKHRQNSTEVEIPRDVTDSNNTSSNIYQEHTKDKKKSMQNSVPDVPTKTNRRNKDHVEKKNEIDNLQEERNVSCKETGKNYQEVAYTSFDPFIHDMIDVPVSFPIPLLHENEAVHSITPKRRVYLEKNGVTIQTGKWTKTEDDILSRNFHQFGLQFGVNNPFQLLGINQNQKDNQLEKFKRAKHFFIRLGKGLEDRSLRSIYMRARKILSPLKNKEKLSAEEADDLKHAHQLVGNKWTRISEMLSRSDNSCQNAFRWHKKNINKGKWTSEEKGNLIKAIKIVSGAEDLSANNVKKISWKAVANYVPTRNEFQCHQQWAEHLAWDSSVTEKGCWERYHYGKLIYLLNEKYTFNSEYEIDWKELYKHFIDVAPSYIFLHKKWLYLKGRLSKGLDLSFKKCLGYFKRKYEEEYQIFTDETLVS